MAARVDLNGIKDALETIFLAANTTTASPIDLSSGLSSRVKKILTVNPEMIVPQASFYPFVTCFIDKKDREGQDIAVDQLNTKRTGIVDVKVVGAVLNQNIVDVTEDPADEDINLLMENVELVLRGNPTLNSKVLWQSMESVEYYSLAINQRNNVRAGILSLRCKVSY